MAFYSAVVAARAFAAAAVDLLSNDDLIDSSDWYGADIYYAEATEACGTSGTLFCGPVRLLLYFKSFDSSGCCNRDALEFLLLLIDYLIPSLLISGFLA